MKKSVVAVLLVTAMLAACAKKKQAPAPTPPPAPAPAARPLPPGGAPPSFKLPKSDGKGGWETPNSDISEAEAIWHLRSALNVAALACDRTGSKGIVAGYNKLLAAQKTAFAKGYAAEGTRHGKGTPLDRHVTSVYNYFAQPPAQAGFCPVAADVLKEAAGVTPAAFPAYAPRALAKLEARFNRLLHRFRRLRDRTGRMGKRRWIENGCGRTDAHDARHLCRPALAHPAWRLFGRQGRARGMGPDQQAHGQSRRFRAALRTRPRQETRPRQIGPVTDRDEAIALCAAASAAALDCFPVAPH